MCYIYLIISGILDIDPTNQNAPQKTILPYSSLFIFGPNNYIRRICHFVANLRFFDIFIMMVIFASSLALAAEDPVNTNPGSLKIVILENLDLAFTTVFLIEMVVKVRRNYYNWCKYMADTF